MANNIGPIIEKLHTQAVAKVEKEIAKERDGRIKKYLATAIRVLVREGIIEADEANAAASKYGIKSSEIGYTPPSDDGGCGSMSRSPSGNRC